MKSSNSDMSTFALTTFNDKYAGDLPGGKETWNKMAHRVATKVLAAVDAEKALVDEVEAAIDAKEFVPGGRYLYATGRPFHQTQNCLLMRVQDSREGWAEHTSNSFMALMTGAGIGAVYSDLRASGSKIRKTGGVASGRTRLDRRRSPSSITRRPSRVGWHTLCSRPPPYSHSLVIHVR